MLALFAAAATHVPTYGEDCVCCRLPHHHDTSQVVYLRNSGGVEIHLRDSLDPVDTETPEILDVDAVFRDEVDPSTFALYIGCGGCAPQDPLNENSRVRFDAYQTAVVEPFTQQLTRSALPEEGRKLSAAALHPSVCPQQHFSVRLVVFENCTRDVVWGAVVGLKESFTVAELLLFPVYITRNHGATWNELGWTWPLAFFVAAPATILLVGCLLELCRARPCWPFTRKRRVASGVLLVEARPPPAREALYALALIGFTGAALEELIHLAYAQSQAPVDYQLWLGLGLVIGLAQGAGATLTLVAWWSMFEGASGGPCACCASPLWAPIEILSGVSLFFLLGSGFYLGPAALALAGVARLFECDPARHRRIVAYRPVAGWRPPIMRMR